VNHELQEALNHLRTDYQLCRLTVELLACSVFNVIIMESIVYDFIIPAVRIMVLSFLYFTVHWHKICWNSNWKFLLTLYHTWSHCTVFALIQSHKFSFERHVEIIISLSMQATNLMTCLHLVDISMFELLNCVMDLMEFEATSNPYVLISCSQ
jgi:hypothetical protein